MKTWQKLGIVALMAWAALGGAGRIERGVSQAGFAWEVRRPGSAIGSKAKSGWAVYMGTATHPKDPVMKVGQFDTIAEALAYAEEIP